ncbi:endolytic transglycosylase MltG [Streptomyces sp. NBC_01518]|uniref:endolytic transglycosylase MltG n=1 Tax=Streptomyces sp. NBC_01518 TaxID=2903891 RepID=UPI003869C069
MTEYGRGPGSEPWHPEDPLFGDVGWEGQQAQVGQQSSYGGQPQHYPEQPQQPQQYGDWGHGQQADYGQAQQQYPGYDEQGNPHYPDQQQWADQQQYADQSHQQYAAQQQQYQQGGWDGTGEPAQVPYAADPGDPYAQQAVAYGEQQPDFYGTPDAFPPPEPPGKRRTEPEPEQTDWDPGPDQGEHAFFAGADDDDEPDDDDPGAGRGRGDRRGEGGKGKKKSRNGCACLLVVLVFGGGLGGVGYFGWHLYENRFRAAPDYAGSGNGDTTTVTIPKDAGGYDIGRLLKAAGVVESVDAFVSAQQANPDGKSIQDGVYTLQKRMSATSAVELMLSPKSHNNLVIAEGLRSSAVYELIDKRLAVPKGTTASVAEKDYKSLGLPNWALNHPNLKDPLEGFLYPSSYAVTKGQKPEAVLKGMVSLASAKYQDLGLEKQAKALGLDGPWQLLTVASLVQAEGTSHDDFRKMAEVVYNRLKPDNPQTYGRLEFDSTYNYVKNQSKIDLSITELRKYDNPYNTYFYKGLPPGPIDNPGEEALKGALNPTRDGWYYFISLDGKTSKFTKTLAEHEKLVNQFNEARTKH